LQSKWTGRNRPPPVHDIYGNLRNDPLKEMESTPDAKGGPEGTVPHGPERERGKEMLPEGSGEFIQTLVVCISERTLKQ